MCVIVCVCVRQLALLTLSVRVTREQRLVSHVPAFPDDSFSIPCGSVAYSE